MKLSQTDLIKISQKTNGRCFYCNKPGEAVDHFVPKKLWNEWDFNLCVGSSDIIENLFLACQHCNSSKRDKCPEEFTGEQFKCWERYKRANRRIGIFDFRQFQPARLIL